MPRFLGGAEVTEVFGHPGLRTVAVGRRNVDSHRRGCELLIVTVGIAGSAAGDVGQVFGGCFASCVPIPLIPIALLLLEGFPLP